MKTIGKILMVILAFALELLGRASYAVSSVLMGAAIMVLSAVKD